MAIEEIRSTDEFSEMLWIATELGKRLPQLHDNPIYTNSIPYYLSGGGYKFITAGPHTTPGNLQNQTAFGFLPYANGRAGGACSRSILVRERLP